MYTLGGLTLPNPKSMSRKIIERGAEHLLLFGKTTKRTENRKEQFTLTFQYLSQAVINSILSQYELETPLEFTASDTNINIGPTTVLVDITGLEFPASGVEYRENLTLVLTEVI